MNDRPWMTALEMQFAALRFAHSALSLGDNPRVGPSMPRGYLGGWAVAAVPLKMATTFAWTRESAAAVLMASKTIPANTPVPVLVLPAGARDIWWWFDEPLQIWGREGQPGISAMLATRLEGGEGSDGSIALIGFRMNSRSSAPNIGLVLLIRPDTTLDKIADDKAQFQTEFGMNPIDGVRFFVAACTWLEQRIVSIDSLPIERHRRRQIAREFEAPISDVKVVQLRRVESQARAASAEADPVEWSCRWIVNGHWRNQYHPSTGKHELKYILPYVKGPDDKPLKVPKQTVYSVSR